MKKSIYLSTLLLLGLSSCKKNDISNYEKVDDSRLAINGKSYSIVELKQMMADYRGVSPDRLVYNSKDSSFTLVNYEGLRFKIVDLLNKFN